MKFERAAQVNARFLASTFQRTEIIAALHELGLEDRQFTILDRPLVSVYKAPETTGLVTRLRGLFGGASANTAAKAPAQDIQVMVHMGQDDRLAEQVRDLFKRSGGGGGRVFRADGRRLTHFYPDQHATDDRDPRRAGVLRAPATNNRLVQESFDERPR